MLCSFTLELTFRILQRHTILKLKGTLEYYLLKHFVSWILGRRMFIIVTVWQDVTCFYLFFVITELLNMFCMCKENKHVFNT